MKSEVQRSRPINEVVDILPKIHFLLLAAFDLPAFHFPFPVEALLRFNYSSKHLSSVKIAQMSLCPSGERRGSVCVCVCCVRIRDVTEIVLNFRKSDGKPEMMVYVCRSGKKWWWSFGLEKSENEIFFLKNIYENLFLLHPWYACVIYLCLCASVCPYV